eukprot:CAMPEP_0171322344 /NCGR_PEP_ID=MMETSP0816-20121228/114898_1 /TAXON_ID=420281 /ORGANISM="Proboscia inermis, Strain CCAP1064/1" /LENGTH=716 /DNA_ID=CAMNT_0011820793 /DNA_START=187 /DNA_END=2337 /DNA_ORIENTATION=-
MGKMVGSSAKSQVASNPSNTVYDVKRIIGRSYADPVVHLEQKTLSYKLTEGSNGEPKIQVKWRGERKSLSPEEVSAMVLTELRLAAEKHLKRSVKAAVITVPAHFNNQQRQATKDAGRIAGLDVKRIINEPTAAALAYGLHSKSHSLSSATKNEDGSVKSNVVIFDLGGGTFDVSVLTLDGGVFEVKATGGDTHLGGEDFDNGIYEWCLEKITKEHGEKEADAIRASASVKAAVITVPAHFNNQQRQATKDAGRIAGLDVKRIINEPTAAALAYGLHSKSHSLSSATKNEDGSVKSNVVIFDLGGGTFDVSVLTLDGGVFEVKATGGDTHLGGEDFDNGIYEWCLEKITKEHGEKEADAIRASARASSRLRRAVESAKRTLSTVSNIEIEVDRLSSTVDFCETLTRTAFEELNGHLFQRCIDTVQSVLVDADCTLGDVTDVVLVGGSTRIPQLQKRLHELFDGRIELCKSVHPDEAVAIGAAVQGHILSTGAGGGGKDLDAASSTTDLLLLDVTPLSLGIELDGRLMSVLIKRNTSIPCRKTRTYTTVDDWQTEIDVVVYEGERPTIDANNQLGSFVISGVERARAGDPKVDVTFALDANGILNVSALDQVTGAEATAEIKAEQGRLSPQDIEQMIADAETYRAADVELVAKSEYKVALEEAFFTAQAKEGKNDEDELELADLMDWLELDSEGATLAEMQGKGRILEDKYGMIVAS